MKRENSRICFETAILFRISIADSGVSFESDRLAVTSGDGIHLSVQILAISCSTDGGRGTSGEESIILVSK
ncbi:hypothetical protein Hanom_Chr10g00964331 [Helianthus anomalus]